MWLKIKLALIAAGTFALGVLWFLLGRAEKRAALAERRVAAHKKVRDVENDVAVAADQAEEKAHEEIKVAVDDARDGGPRDYFE